MGKRYFLSGNIFSKTRQFSNFPLLEQRYRFTYALKVCGDGVHGGDISAVIAVPFLSEAGLVSS